MHASAQKRPTRCAETTDGDFVNPYDRACKYGVFAFLALAMIGLAFPATAKLIVAVVVMFAFFMITGGLVFAVVVAAKAAKLFDMTLK